MQIRLTVVDPLGPPDGARGRAASCDVLVTAPAGTALAAVASALASAVAGEAGAGRESGSGTAVLYAGDLRLDPQRCTLGEPPLTDGAVLCVGAPGEPEPHPELDDAPAQLHVVAGPDAGGVHLLHGGEIRVGRSADADVPLDDPDVSRLHCAVTVTADGRVSVADLDSTNGTTLDGRRVGPRPVRFPPGALLRIGESALRLAPPGGPGGRVETAPDGEGHVRVPDPSGAAAGSAPAPTGPGEVTHHSHGTAGWGTPGRGHGPDEPPLVPGQGAAPAVESRGEVSGAGPAAGRPSGGNSDEHFAVRPGTRADEDGSRAPLGHRAPTVPGEADTHAGRSGVAGHPGRSGVAGPGEAAPAAPTAYTAVSATAHPGAAAPGTRAPGAPGAAPTGPGAAASGGTTARTTAHSSASPHAPAATSSPTAVSRDDSAPHGGTPPRDAAPHGVTPPDRSGRGSADPRTSAPGVPAPRTPGTPARDGSRPGGAPGFSPGGVPGSRPGVDGAGLADPDDRAPGSTGRKGTPLRGTELPQQGGGRRRGGLGAWARRLAGGRGDQDEAGPEAVYEEEPAEAVAEPPAAVGPVRETWPDPATLLLTALGPGPRLWERGPGHPEVLAVRLGTADRAAPDGSRLLPAVPVTAGLREVGALGLAGPRDRLAGLARAVLAQLAALHSPDTLEIVLVSADRARPVEERTAAWSWLGWLPHVRPGHGQDCRLLLAYDREQATARTGELLRRLEDLAPQARPAPRDPARRPSWARDDAGAGAADGFTGPYTVLVVDGDPGGAGVREAVARLALEGPRAGIHVVCLAETAAASPVSPVTETYEAACAVSPAFRECGAVALLSGDVATALRLMRVAHPGQAATGSAAPAPISHGTIATVDAVSLPWAERFARALAPLRPDTAAAERHPRVSAPLPQAARLLDELGLARATPASLMARWADAADDPEALGGRVCAVLGAGPRGPLGVDLAADGPHLLIEGPAGSGRTELLRAVVASLAAAERPDRLGVVLVDGRGGTGSDGAGEGLRVCTDVPHVTTHLAANDPVRMREFAQSLTAELKRRAELLGRSGFAEWHTGRALSGRMVAQRTAATRGTAGGAEPTGDLDAPPSTTIRLRPGAARRQTEAAPPLPRLVVVVDDLDALVSPALGSPGRPAAGSVMRALEAVARDGERLGVHLVAATGPCTRTAQTEPVRRATLRITLDPPAPGPDEPAPGRGRLAHADGRVTPFQGGRVTGRIPRTATLRPTVVPLEWHRMGDPPARRPVRELGNGPTDLALLASALERAAREVAAVRVPSLL
ncbi:FHA domain-containing protein [Streptomyces sp. NPDC052682]|uniref:FHA domain-containing protein n=1 Tax=Streptomyces sp. NPDC052682 TaxID=3154954 RepID=UPI0034332B47